MTSDTKLEHGVATVANTYGGNREGHPDYIAASTQNRIQTNGADDVNVIQPCVLL